MMARRYEPDRSGIRDLGREKAIGDACAAAGRAVAARANQIDPGGAYVVSEATVAAGYGGEERRGAVVEETKQGKGAETRALARAANEVNR